MPTSVSQYSNGASQPNAPPPTHTKTKGPKKPNEKPNEKLPEKYCGTEQSRQVFASQRGLLEQNCGSWSDSSECSNEFSDSSNCTLETDPLTRKRKRKRKKRSSYPLPYADETYIALVPEHSDYDTSDTDSGNDSYFPVCYSSACCDSESDDNEPHSTEGDVSS